MLQIQILISCKLAMENHPHFMIIIGNLIAGDMHLFHSIQFVYFNSIKSLSLKNVWAHTANAIWWWCVECDRSR